jgi:hypothetical protein
MQRTHWMTRIAGTILVCLALLAAVSAASAKTDDKALVGTWNMVSVTPDGDQVKWMLAIKEGADGKLVGSLKSDEGEQEAKDFSVTEGVVKLKTPYGGDYYDIEVKLAEGKLAGKWSGGGSEGETTGTKAE